MSGPGGSLRQSMAWIHGWAGLVLGWLILAIAVTGTASVFRSEIDDWMRPEVTARADPVDAIAAATRYLAKVAPTSPSWFLTAPSDRTSATIALYKDATGYRRVALDPVTGRPDGIRDTLGGEFLYRFHFQLQLPYPWGRIVASAAGMALLVILLSGIITHRRIFVDFFTIRPGKAKRSWLDLHNALGVFAMPFHLMIALTGVLTLITLTLPWAATARYAGDTLKFAHDLAPAYIVREKTGRRTPPADIATMLRDARRRFEGGGIGLVTIDNPGDAAALIRIGRSDADQLAYGAAVAVYTMADGRLAAFHAETRPAKRTYDVLYGLHLGRFAPAFAHWLYFVSGLILSATIATGMILWSRSRLQGAGFGHRLVARSTIGAVVGLPLAVAAFVWANRVLPAGAVGRADGEVAAFFWTLAVALVMAAMLPPKLGWRIGAGACAAAWGLLPPWSWVATGRGLPMGLMRGDWTFVAFDLVAFGFAGMAAACLVALIRHRPAAPRLRRAS